jgi:acetolactate synthase-1/2/3 large subunit
VPAGAPLAAARDWLAEARRPLAIAGLDAVNGDAAEAVAAFCRAHAVPLITTYKGKGLLPEDDPLALGGAGLSPKADRLLLPLVRQADLILLLGYDPIEMRIGWRDPWPPEARVVDITPVTRTHGMHAVSLSLKGDVGAAIEALSDGIPMRDDAWLDGAPARTRAALAEAFAPPAAWGPGQAFATLREVLPAATVATADSGAHRILLSQMWRCPAPRTLLQSSALCTMGCAVPIAAGYKLARPQVPVVAFVGDAGLEMVLGELATLRDLGLAVIIVVLVDASLALIEMKQRNSQLANVGVDFGATDFAAVAAAFGGHGALIDDAGTLRREAADALARHDRFSLLAVRIPRRAYDGTF